MRCPKCHYLSFEPEPRCRNCGHALDITGPLDMPIPGLVADDLHEPAPADTPPRLTLDTPKPAAPARPSATEPVKPPSEAGPPPALMRERPRLKPDPPPGPFDQPREIIEPPAVPSTVKPAVTLPAEEEEPVFRREVPRPPAVSAAPTTELPLFVKGLSETSEESDLDEPLVKVPPSPRAPLAVRMKTPETVPVQNPGKETSDQNDALGDLLDDLRRLDRFEHRHGASDLRRGAEDRADDDRPAASSRAIAAGIDAGLLAGVTLLVLWVTLRWCDLSIAQIAILPIVPTATFLVLIVVGYLLLFTAAGGQTIGKMVARIRVVDDGSGERDMLTIGQAFYRSCATVAGVALLGFGWFPALVGQQRALHDRLAGTRVVQA